MEYKLFKDAANEWRWRLEASNGKIIADSGEGYKRKIDAKRGIDLVMTSSKAEVTEEKKSKDEKEKIRPLSFPKSKKQI